MKKIVLTFGLISGVIMSVIMLATVPFMNNAAADHGYLIGYSSMVLAFLLIYFGVRSYRDNVGGGKVSFGRALAVGALISLVASSCYVATWEVIYYRLAPNWISNYQAHEMDKARAAGASAEKLAKKKAELDSFAEMYKNPLVNIAFTFLEPLPVAVVMTLVTAGVLSTKKKQLAGDGGVVRA
jgi:hypothetical protein